jgi:hypothetical protein
MTKRFKEYYDSSPEYKQAHLTKIKVKKPCPDCSMWKHQNTKKHRELVDSKIIKQSSIDQAVEKALLKYGITQK